MATTFPIIKSERLLLRQFEPLDQANVFKGLSHAEVIKYYGVSYDSFEGTKAQMDWFAKVVEEQTGIWWAVCSPDNKEFYGAGGLYDWNHDFKKAEIGLWLLPAYWSKGIMTETMKLIVDYAFEKMDINRIEAIVESGNDNCNKAMQKLEFLLEGTMIEGEIKNGKPIDLNFYAALKSRRK